MNVFDTFIPTLSFLSNRAIEFRLIKAIGFDINEIVWHCKLMLIQLSQDRNLPHPSLMFCVALRLNTETSTNPFMRD